MNIDKFKKLKTEKLFLLQEDYQKFLICLPKQMINIINSICTTYNISRNLLIRGIITERIEKNQTEIYSEVREYNTKVNEHIRDGRIIY